SWPPAGATARSACSTRRACGRSPVTTGRSAPSTAWPSPPTAPPRPPPATTTPWSSGTWTCEGRAMLVLKHPGSRGAVWSLAFAPGGERLIACGTSYPLLVWDLRGPPRVEAAPNVQALSAALSPDGRTLACLVRGGVTLLFLDTNATHSLPVPAGWQRS